jgi:hypothetical protein
MLTPAQETELSEEAEGLLGSKGEQHAVPHDYQHDAQPASDALKFDITGQATTSDTDSTQQPRPAGANEKSKRFIHSIPKATVVAGNTYYFIIYSDNVNSGHYVRENELTQEEAQYINENIDNIKILRSKPKKLTDY